MTLDRPAAGTGCILELSDARGRALRSEWTRPVTSAVAAVAPADFRCGIDGLARRVRQVLATDPMGGAVFVFRHRRGTAIKLLAYDGQGFWRCHQRLS